MNGYSLCCTRDNSCLTNLKAFHCMLLSKRFKSKDKKLIIESIMIMYHTSVPSGAREDSVQYFVFHVYYELAFERITCQRMGVWKTFVFILYVVTFNHTIVFFSLCLAADGTVCDPKILSCFCCYKMQKNYHWTFNWLFLHYIHVSQLHLFF